MDTSAPWQSFNFLIKLTKPFLSTSRSFSKAQKKPPFSLMGPPDLKKSSQYGKKRCVATENGSSNKQRSLGGCWCDFPRCTSVQGDHIPNSIKVRQSTHCVRTGLVNKAMKMRQQVFWSFSSSLFKLMPHQLKNKQKNQNHSIVRIRINRNYGPWDPWITWVKVIKIKGFNCVGNNLQKELESIVADEGDKKHTALYNLHYWT